MGLFQVRHSGGGGMRGLFFFFFLFLALTFNKRFTPIMQSVYQSIKKKHWSRETAGVLLVFQVLFFTFHLSSAALQAFLLKFDRFSIGII